MAIDTALDGALERHLDGWRWRDGSPEPRVRDMLLADIAPNFRCVTGGSGMTVVEIPLDWRNRKYWPRERIDPQAANEITALITESGKRGAIYAEGLAETFDDHRLRKGGYRVPVALWDAAMREPVGVWWDKTDETDILARAEQNRG